LDLGCGDGTAAVSRGTGLGLTVAEGIVTQHGGTISACNRAEGGATLEVSLPAR